MTMGAASREKLGTLSLVAISAGLGVIAFLAIDALQARVAAIDRTCVRLATVRAKANELNAVEWEAIHRATIDAELRERLESARAGAQAELDAALGDGGLAATDLRRQLADYLEAMSAEFAFIERQDIEAALEADEARVDPAYDRFSATIDRVSSDCLIESARTEWIVRLATFSVLLLAASTTALFLHRIHWGRLDAARRRGEQDALLAANAVLRAEIEQRRLVERDLDQARRAAEEASRAKSNFLATMSHEIRTPVNGVMGMAALLDGMQLTLEQAECVQTIHACGRSLLGLFGQVLDFAKIEAGSLVLEQEEFDLRALVADVLAPVLHDARGKGLRVEHSLAAASRSDSWATPRACGRSSATC